MQIRRLTMPFAAVLCLLGASAPTALGQTARVIRLVDVERAAIAQQPQLRAARAAAGAAESAVEVARAPLLPQVTATAQYTRQTGNFVPRPGALPSSATNPALISMTTSYDFFNFGLSASQIIYDFGQTSKRYSAAERTADAQRLSEQTIRLQVLHGVRRAYFTARANKELVDVANETLVNQKKHLTQVQGFVAAGTQPEVAAAQQRAAVANAQVLLIGAQNAYETAKAQLNQAAGIAGGTDYDVGDETIPAIEDEDQPLDVLVAKALSARPELTVLAKQHEAQEAAVSSARGGYGPTLSAFAGATEAGPSLDGLVPNWNVGALLTYPLFQGGLTKGQVAQSEWTLQGIDAQRSFEELQVRLDVDSARLAVLAAKATISAAEEAALNAREQLRLAEQRYTTGVGSIIELNDAQVTYTNAAAQVVQARYGLAGARAQLLAALGRG
jgi:outer membrane protein